MAITTTKWTDEMIKKGIMDYVKTKNINIMPTHSELKEFYGNYCLTNAIRRHKGTKYWADKLGLKIKDCESKLGEKYEGQAVADIFSNLGLESELCPVRYPYDLLVENAVKVDVKFSREFNNYGGAKYFTCNIEKEQQTCDIFVVYCVGEDNTKVLIIPSYVVSGKTQIAIGIKESKYDEYENRWDIIKQYCDFISTATT